MSRDPRLEIITEAIERLVPGAAPANMTVEVCEQLLGGGQNRWTGRPDGLAEKVFAALFGRPRTGEERSPRAQAEDAKRARDIGAELGIVMAAAAELGKAPWYPARPGDLVHIHYEQAGESPAFGETYIVGDAGGDLLSLQLLTHTHPHVDDESDCCVGCLAAEASDEPLYEAWFEAGPQRLTIVRDGRPVHIGGAR